MSQNEPHPHMQYNCEDKKAWSGKTIIIFHGWGSSTKNYEEFAKTLSSRGFQVIVPELTFHDGRDKLENHFNKRVTQEYFWETIFRSIDDSSILLKELKILNENTILLGVSMGGFIATGILAKFPDLAGLININGSGSFLLSEKIFRKNDKRPELLPEEVQKLTAYNPIKANTGSSSILLMHGKEDTIVSIKGQEDYYAYLTEEPNTGNITFLRYKNINHSISEEMKRDLMRWLEENF